MKFRDNITIQEAHKFVDYYPDEGVFIRKISSNNYCKEGAIAGHVRSDGYRMLCINNKKCLEHRLAWLMFYGEYPKDQIDHIDGDKSNNRISNLRLSSPSKNSMNKGLQSNNKSGVRGVCFVTRDKRWWARIRCNGKWHNLGYYTNKEDAIIARKNAETKFFGEYARAA